MDTPRLYIETSIVSYLAADTSRHPATLRNQQAMHVWWNTRRDRYALYTSVVVEQEAAQGNPIIAQRRLALLAPLPLLALNAEVGSIAEDLRRGVPFPPRAETDALHIALAAVHGMAYLLTWDRSHIANPRLRARIERVRVRWGLELPILCTPGELLGGQPCGIPS